jgi:hypothetical protein
MQVEEQKPIQMCGLDLVVVVILCLEIIKKKKMENNLWFNQSGAQNSTELWFNQSGDAVITVGGDKYSYEPVLTWDRGCDSMDDRGDGIFTNKDCKTKSKFGGVEGLKLGAYRFKNGVMDN